MYKSALLTIVLVVFAAAQEVPVPAWRISTDDPNQTLVQNNNAVRDIACNHKTGHLYLLSTHPQSRVVVLQASTGDSLKQLDTEGIATDAALNQIFVTPSGEIYACNHAKAFKLYKWQDESKKPELVFTQLDSNGHHFGASLTALYDSSDVRLYIGSDHPMAKILVLQYKNQTVQVEERVNLSIPVSDLDPVNPETFWALHPKTALTLYNTFGSPLTGIDPFFTADSGSAFEFFPSFSGISFLASVGKTFNITELSDDYSVGHHLWQSNSLQNDFQTIPGAIEIALDLKLAFVLAPNNRLTAYDISDLVDADIPSTGIVLGKVISAMDYSAVVGAEVLLQGTDFIVTADDHGEYGLIEVPIGSYQLVARHPEYISQTLTIKVGADSVVLANFELHPKPTAPPFISAFPRGEHANVKWNYATPDMSKSAPLQRARCTTDFFMQDILGYNIYRGESVQTLKFLDYLPSDSMSFIDQQPWPDSTYYYAVTALYLDGETEPAIIEYFHPPLLTIKDAKRDTDLNFKPDLAGNKVTLEGVITTPNFSPQRSSFFIQDDSAAIHLFSDHTDLFDYAGLKSGDRIYVTGHIGQQHGLTELRTDLVQSLVVVGKNQPLPAAERIPLSGLNETTEGKLVQLEHVALVDPQQWPQAGNNGIVYVTDGTDSVQVYIDKDTDLDEWQAPTVYFTLVGVTSQHTLADTADNGYRIKPRSKSDFILQTGISEQRVLPAEFTLKQNYPNPFNPSTTICLELPKPCRVDLSLYNIIGEKVRELYTGNLAAGVHHFDVVANELPSGTYIYRVWTAEYSEMKKMLLLK